VVVDIDVVNTYTFDPRFGALPVGAAVAAVALIVSVVVVCVW
jgi:hypothetical protein